jgi:glutathione S-transferase
MRGDAVNVTLSHPSEVRNETPRQGFPGAMTIGAMTIDRTLHHFSLDPYSRQVRLALGEKKLTFQETIERYWERPEALAALNPSGAPPVLVERKGGVRLVVCESRAILEHLEEAYPDRPLLALDPQQRAEARRWQHWFDRKFDYEVNGLILHEKMEKRLLGLGAPDLAALRRGREMLRAHFETLETTLQARDWLAGDGFGLGDIAAAAHLSVIDYMGEAPWEDFRGVRTWYAKVKSRPAFRPLLADRQPGLPPAPHYDDLDF